MTVQFVLRSNGHAISSVTVLSPLIFMNGDLFLDGQRESFITRAILTTSGLQTALK